MEVTKFQTGFETNFAKDIQTVKNIFGNEKLFLVGGCVRDIMLNRTPKDFDFCTNLHPDLVIELIKNYNPSFNVVEVGKSFGVIKVLIGDSEFEIATFRKDIGEGRRPDSVEYTDEKTDIQRRDFTMNGLLFEISEINTTDNIVKGTIIDYCGGIEDINNKVIRCIGDAKQRFSEDPLRKLRAIRFASVLNFEIEKETYKILYEDFSLNGVSNERIREEWIKAFSSKNFNKDLYVFQLFNLGFFEANTSLKYLINKDISIYNIPKIGSHYLIAFFQLMNIKNPNFSYNWMEKSLKEMAFTNDEINDIKLLTYFSNHIDDTSWFKVIKKIKPKVLTRIEILSIFPGKEYRINKYLDFEPWVNSLTLINQGFSGKELGEKILEMEIMEFFN